MVERRDVMGINFLKKKVFTGSCRGMRYLLRRQEVEGENRLEAVIWPGPFILEKTDTQKQQKQQFAFSTEGIDEAVDWLNEQYETQRELWEEREHVW